MEDAQIIDHFFRRDPEAITAVQEKYEKRCLAAARHILPDARDAEECVSDVWLRLWNAIPPERPRSLAAYITTVTRRLALDKCDYNRAAQRRSDLTVAFEELEGCLPAEDGAVRALEQQEFRRVLNGFLRKLTRQSRTYFIRRYWYGESIREIADSCGAGEALPDICVRAAMLARLQTFLNAKSGVGCRVALCLSGPAGGRVSGL